MHIGQIGYVGGKGHIHKSKFLTWDQALRVRS